MTERKVLIVDDHPIVRQGLRRMIEPQSDLTVSGEAENEIEARAAISECMPDVIIVDISLGTGDGFELVRDVHEHYPRLPVLVFSMHDEIIYAERVLAAGASGYIMKQAAPERILLALREVLGGGTYMSAKLRGNLRDGRAVNARRGGRDPVSRMITRELQVLSLIGRGRSTREAAQTLQLSIKTVETHRQSLKRKLSLANNARLVQFAVNWFASREQAACA